MGHGGQGPGQQHSEEEGSISQDIKEHQSQNLPLGFMSKIHAKSFPGMGSHPELGLQHNKPPAAGPRA